MDMNEMENNNIDEAVEVENVSPDYEVVVDTEKHEKFYLETAGRIKSISSQINLLKKIAAKRGVDFTDEDINKMFTFLEDELGECKGEFVARLHPQEKKTKGFTW